jgi:hypothetical protein
MGRQVSAVIDASTTFFESLRLRIVYTGRA